MGCVSPTEPVPTAVCEPFGASVEGLWDEVVACRADTFTTRVYGPRAAALTPARWRAWIAAREATLLHDDTHLPFTSLVVRDPGLGRFALTIVPEPTVDAPHSALVTLTLLPDPS